MTLRVKTNNVTIEWLYQLEKAIWLVVGMHPPHPLWQIRPWILVTGDVAATARVAIHPDFAGMRPDFKGYASRVPTEPWPGRQSPDLWRYVKVSSSKYFKLVNDGSLSRRLILSKEAKHYSRRSLLIGVPAKKITSGIYTTMQSKEAICAGKSAERFLKQMKSIDSIMVS